MSAAPEFSRAEAERMLGPAVVEKVRRVVDSAPPLRPELREQIRALFRSAREIEQQAPPAEHHGPMEAQNIRPGQLCDP